ncbi:MAG: nucleotidyltransferase domain-containing protein [Kiritimatiellae bacterium]|nr:nucleotidyltransferase domain-containing protein [Kiritimatiellia bacterium]
MTTQIENVLEIAADALKQLGAHEIYVFGSAANGRIRDESDIDLAVTGLSPELFFKAMSRATDILGRPVDLVDLDDESPFVHYLKEEKELRRVG